MPKPSLVIFDFDGTIADTITSGLAFGNEMLVEMGKKPITMAEFHELRKLSIHEALKKYDISMIQVPALAMQLQKKQRLNAGNVKPFKGIPKMLTTLVMRGYPLQVLTTNAKDIVETFLKTNDINVFTEVTSERNLFGKSASLKKILKHMNKKPEEVIYIGDEVRDIEACKKVGIEIISVTWGLQSRGALEKAGANYLADTPGDILNILL